MKKSISSSINVIITNPRFYFQASHLVGVVHTRTRTYIHRYQHSHVRIHI